MTVLRLIIFTMVCLSTGFLFAIIHFPPKKDNKDEIHAAQVVTPFSVSQYLERMEQVQLDILNDLEPADQTIILWLGLDGLRLDENGDLEWISRKKKNPGSHVSVRTASTWMCQNTAQLYPTYTDFCNGLRIGTFPVNI